MFARCSVRVARCGAGGGRLMTSRPGGSQFVFPAAMTKGRAASSESGGILPRRTGGRRPRPRDGAPPEPALKPILIPPGGGDDPRSGTARPLPAGLRHLPRDARIEIFNRRTGRIMTGNDAVRLSDLPRALMDHAEYEPIVPPPPGNCSGIRSRVGRSGPNIRVSSNVVPQTRVRASRVEGRSVLVTGGEYRGLSGKIDSCIPGGWYLVSNLMKNDKLDVVINSRNLELIPEGAKNNNIFVVNPSSPSAEPAKEESLTKVRIHLRAAKLRLDAFSEEKKGLISQYGEIAGAANFRLGAFPEEKKVLKSQYGEIITSGDTIDASQVRKLNAEIDKTKKLIANLQSELDRRRGGQSDSKLPSPMQIVKAA